MGDIQLGEPPVYYKPADVQNLWIAAGGDPKTARTAAAIPFANEDTTGNAGLANDSPPNYAVGLWQLNYTTDASSSEYQFFAQWGTPLQLANSAKLQAEAAVATYKKYGWNPWAADMVTLIPNWLAAHPANVVGMAATPDGGGYWLVTADGVVYPFGNAKFFGGPGGKLSAPAVGVAATNDGLGYWVVARDGAISNFGNAGALSIGSKPEGNVVGVAFAAVETATHPQLQGLRVVTNTGEVFPVGAATGAAGPPGPIPPVVGVAEILNGQGYWLVTSTGEVFNFGGAGWFGDHRGSGLAKPIAGIAAAADGQGYWLSGADGGLFAYHAKYDGGANTLKLSAPIVGMAATPDGGGYWQVGADGGVFGFGDAHFHGSLP